MADAAVWSAGQCRRSFFLLFSLLLSEIVAREHRSPDTNNRAGEGHTWRRRLHGEGPCMHAITIFITALRDPVSGSALSHLHSIDLTVVCMSHPIPYRLLHLAFTPD